MKKLQEFPDFVWLAEIDFQYVLVGGAVYVATLKKIQRYKVGELIVKLNFVNQCNTNWQLLKQKIMWFYLNFTPPVSNHDKVGCNVQE